MSKDKNERLICGFIDFFNEVDENFSISQNIQKLTYDGVVYISTKVSGDVFYNEIIFKYNYDGTGNIIVEQSNNLKTTYLFPTEGDVWDVMDKFYMDVMSEYISLSGSYKNVQDCFEYFMSENESDYGAEEHIVEAKKKFKKG